MTPDTLAKLRELEDLWRALVEQTRAEPWFDGRAERIACFDTAADQLRAILAALREPEREPDEAAVERAGRALAENDNCPCTDEVKGWATCGEDCICLDQVRVVLRAAREV